MLAPPPLAPRPVRGELSFQAISGRYPKTEEKSGELTELQTFGSSLNSVPPTAVISGNDAGNETAKPWLAGYEPWSQAAAPESPEDAIHVMPWALACCARSRMNVASLCDTFASHVP